MSKIKLNTQTEAIVLTALEDGATYSIAAGAAGVQRQTLINWIKKGNKERAVDPYKSFVQRVRLSEAKGALIHLRVVKAAALDGQWRASIALLERRHNMTKEGRTETDADFVESPKSNPILDYRTLLEQGQIQLQEAMSAAKKSESWQAYSSLFSKSISLMEHLKSLDAEEGRLDSMDNMTDNQLIKTITDSIIALPKGLRQRVEEELSELSKSNVVILRRQ